MEKEQLIQVISEAFADVSRGDGITLHEAMALDDRLSAMEVAKARLKDTDTRWQDIDPHSLQGMESALCFFDKKGFRYYLPVYMIADVQDEFKFLYSAPFFSLTKISGFSQRKTTPEMVIEKYDFSAMQTKAIAAYIQYIQHDRIGYDGKADKLSEERWKKYL